MNIHEYQAKEILRQFGVAIPNGVVILNLEDLRRKIKNLNSKTLVLKAQIHAGGRGKAGGIKLTKNINDLTKEAQEMFGKVLVTHQTGATGREVKKLYIEGHPQNIGTVPVLKQSINFSVNQKSLLTFSITK